MIGYSNFQQFSPFSQSNYSQNYNNYNSYNSYNTNYYPQENNQYNLTNIFNNYESCPIMGQQPIIRQAPPVCYQEQGNSSEMMQMLEMLLPLLMGSGTSQAAQPTNVDQTTTTVTPNSTAWGDPHFTTTGSDGKTAINFTQEGKAGDTYNVFQGDGLEVNAKYSPWNTGNCIMTQAQIKAGADTIDYNDKGQLSIDGNKIKKGANITLNDGTQVALNGTTAVITPKNGNGAKITLKDNTNTCIAVDPTGQFSGLGGILGTAIAKNKNLTEAQADSFDVTNDPTKKIA